LFNERSISDFVIEPLIEADSNWRISAKRYLEGGETNNQGNVFKSNRPRISYDELYFRTIEEQFVYQVLVGARIPFMPLPVLLSGAGKKRPDGTSRRIEPDFCFLLQGRFAILEIDSGSHIESPVDAEKRVQFLRERGAIIRRLEAGRIKDEPSAQSVVQEALTSIDAEIGKR
jgi:hypothetical protein